MFFFIGSYTEKGSPAPVPLGAGITSCYFDPRNGTIKIIGNQFQRNPSYPILSNDRRILYAAEETFVTEDPRLVSYRILGDGNLSKLNSVPLKGDFACHMAIASRSIVVANYVSGDMLVYSLTASGRIGPVSQQICHSGSGLHKERQEAPHPHMIFPIDDVTFYCVDLGIDKAIAYSFEAASKQWEPVPEWDIKVAAGAGARHMDSNGEWMAMIGELSGELFLFRKIEERFQLVDTAYLGTGEMSAAAIRLHASGKYIYCSERKTNSIYSFMVSGNKLQLIGKTSSRGKTPRDISIDPTGKWLLAANQDDNTIAVFSIDSLTGELRFANSCNVLTPTSICWQ